MSLSTHALDTATGAPAAGLTYRLTDSAGTELATGSTDHDGRAPELAAVEIGAGVHRLAFDTGGYHHGRGVSGFYPEAVVCFEVTDPAAHHHVPLILSPFGYSTYRGS
ncbi:MAG: hydroxyisourate hydrolase [Dietzia sp.]